MKRIICFLSLLSSIAASSQTYTPLLNNYNEWHVTGCYFGCDTDIYYTDGDTMVDGLQYKILDGYHYIMRTALLREVVAEKKVYLLFITGEHSSTEYLLYDFSLNVGDSIEMNNVVSPFVTQPGYFTLDSIQFETLVDGNDYRHFYFSANDPSTAQTDNAIWIEGVGSLTLISAPGSYPDVNGVGKLSCFYKEVDLFYAQTDSISGCSQTSPIASITEEAYQALFEVYPTITYDNIFINSDKVIDEIYMTDMNGSIVLSKILFSKSAQINCSMLQPGVYFFYALSGGSISNTTRIIKE